MGNDGGSIPKRRELVKEAARALTTAELKESQQEAQEYGWTTDPLTRKPLAKPVVSDAAGVLYNKDAVIEFLLKDEAERGRMEVGSVGGNGMGGVNGVGGAGGFAERVKGLRDVVEVKFEENEDGRWVCPVTGRELGPGAKACYIVPCGHAFAGSVVREIREGGCLQCNEPYAENDVIPILPTLPTDIARLSVRIKTLKEKGLTHALKKAPGSKKRKKHAEPDTTTTTTTTTTHVGDTTTQTPSNTTNPSAPPSNEQKPKPTPTDPKKPAPAISHNGIKNASTASLTRKVLEEQEERNKRRKLTENQNVKSLFHKSEDRPDMKKSADYMTRGFSIGRK